MLKSYEVITSTCKLINVTNNEIRREEIWRDSTHTYSCVWLCSRDAFIPTIITHTKNVF